MRVAIVSDIHGNLSALEAVVASLREDRPHTVVHAGDLVVTGPRPSQVVERIRELGWPGALGNTDEMLWNESVRAEQERLAPKIVDWLAVLFDTLAPWAKAHLMDEHLQWLRALPPEVHIGEIRVMHASPKNRWRAPMPDASDEELSAAYGGLGARVVAYGHIHRPFVRKLGWGIVVNAGSVGLPYDGDPRASYALIDDDVTTIRRVSYDLDAEHKAIREANFPLAEWLIQIERQGRFSRPA